MNADQVGGIVRALVPAGVAWLVGRGVIPESAAADIGAAITAVGAAVWSWFKNRP